MDLTYTLDDVARTSDEAAVRAEFDRRTFGVMRLLSVLATVISFPHVMFAIGHGQFRRIVVALFGFVVAAVVMLSVRKKATHRIAQYLRRRVRGVALFFALAWAASIIITHAPGEGMIAMSIMIPPVFLLYRLLPAEHVLLYTGFSVTSVVTGVILPPVRESFEAMIIPPLIVNALLLGVSLWYSRRARRQIVSDWTERRASAREQIRMRDELQYAREIQMAMLPEGAPQLDWVDVAGVSMPATEVGGDYYDYFVEGNRLAMVCGDVAGHGLASGLVLASLRSGFTLLRDSLDRPGYVLQRLHDLIAHTSRRRMLATVAVVLLDRDARRATIASAGHPPILLRRNGTIRTIELFAPPLGVRLPVEIPEVSMDLAPGDLFVLHSDGVYEARNANDETYGFERLEALVLAHPADASAESLRDAIAQDVETFRAGAAQDDDVTIVVGRVTEGVPLADPSPSGA
jgi:serine phosphatase RsbU (regulator of sigma subunit)